MNWISYNDQHPMPVNPDFDGDEGFIIGCRGKSVDPRDRNRPNQVVPFNAFPRKLVNIYGEKQKELEKELEIIGY